MTKKIELRNGLVISDSDFESLQAKPARPTSKMEIIIERKFDEFRKSIPDYDDRADLELTNPISCCIYKNFAICVCHDGISDIAGYIAIDLSFVPCVLKSDEPFHSWALTPEECNELPKNTRSSLSKRSGRSNVISVTGRTSRKNDKPTQAKQLIEMFIFRLGNIIDYLRYGFPFGTPRILEGWEIGECTCLNSEADANDKYCQNCGGLIELNNKKGAD